MKILKLTVENIMRVSAVEIEPSGNVVVIGGQNAQGKSSVLSAIEMALGGKGRAVDQPLRAGATSGRVLIDLGKITVERVFTDKGTTRLTVREAGRGAFQSPQAMLDHLVGKLTFDPLQFARTSSKEQVDILRNIAGIDTSGIDVARAEAYESRTIVNRELKILSSQLDAVPPIDEELPGVIPDSGTVLSELDALNKRNESRRKIEQLADQATLSRIRCAKAVDATAHEIERLRGLLGDQERLLSERQSALEAAQKAEAEQAEAWQVAQAQIESPESLREMLANSNALADKIARKRQRDKLFLSVEAKQSESDSLTARIEALDCDKKNIIASAQFPVEGLSLDDDGVIYKDIPFAQASGAEKLRVSVAIGIALNPNLRVMLIRDGSLLDERGLKLLGQLAEQADVQMWIEKVGVDENVQVVIEDGMVESIRPGVAAR